MDLYDIDGKEIIILAEGRLVNLGCATGHPSFVMSNSFTNQTLLKLSYGLIIKIENKVYMLQHLDEKVAKLHLDKLGVELEELNSEQAEYIGVKIQGPYKLNIIDIKLYENFSCRYWICWISYWYLFCRIR